MLKNALKEIVNLVKDQNNNNSTRNNPDFDLINKSMKYNGNRDPFVIDNWIHSISAMILWR
jgi:hypothetical protein